MQKSLEPGTLVKYVGDTVDFKDTVGVILPNDELDNGLVLVRIDSKDCTCIFNRDNIEQIPELSLKHGDSEPVAIESLREPYKSGIVEYRHVAPVPKEVWDELGIEEKRHTPYTEKIQRMSSATEAPTAAIDNPTKIWGILNEPKVYQNLRLGAGSQADILSAVAKLKAFGLHVEFI